MAKGRFRALLIFVLGALLGTTGCGQAKDYPNRWVYMHGKPLENMDQVALIRKVAKTAAEHGLNGLVLDAFFDRIDMEPPYNYKNLQVIMQICKDNNLEFIPAVFGMGYNAPLLAHDKNLIEGLPVKDALYVVSGKEARLADDPPVEIANGGFEMAEAGAPANFTLNDNSGETVALDKTVAKAGSASLAVAMSKEYEEGEKLATQEVAVHPYRCYLLSCWVKTEGLEGSGDVFPMLVQAPDGRRLQYYIPPVPGTSDWVRAVIGFNSRGNDKVLVSVGTPAGKSGKFWVDELKIEEEGLVNVLRREGTPLVVRGEQSGIAYEEGRDFAPVSDPVMTLLFDHPDPPVTILPGSRIKDGERLRVSFYHNYPIYNGQTPACMSEPKLYEIWRKTARMVHEYVKPNKYFLGTDELREAGSCEACGKRGLNVAQILGDCVTKQEQIIRELNPKAELFIWSDMFDPTHNAPGDYHKGYFYHVDETFENSWNYIPKDLIMVCWNSGKRDKSLEHFQKNGFRTFGSCSGGPEGTRAWLEALDKTKGSTGLMYTTWSENFETLAEFGDIVNRKK
ncbi:MAG: hypothetical protein A3F83_16290 [Candidatus Glassbacteria bacterium RIFCSPLOWO2_12_FULL_58_11]|uniref:Uncharacterized protein n=1 Tax=Candidatus Glassbacteria bacterium RIFCSPLOWO2_12_FULL_58_11 TaxID=1817867 RepID=A0A1F5Z2C1_9BACT|nr:MAG: hypothetical protein A3F83_16290 [Candidatus Glassbacteria bacterium RIFCSPLOWO2_12_FULL_58_11]